MNHHWLNGDTRQKSCSKSSINLKSKKKKQQFSLPLKKHDFRMFSRWVAFHFPPFKIQPTRGFCLTFKLPGPSWTRSARRARPSATSSGNSVSASAMAKREMKSSKMNCQTRNGRTETETVHRSLLKMGWRGCVGFFGGRKHILGMKAELFVAILDFWGVVFFLPGENGDHL